MMAFCFVKSILLMFMGNLVLIGNMCEGMFDAVLLLLPVLFFFFPPALRIS